MIDLTKRSYRKEILDSDEIPFEDIRQNMKELNIINTYLGGHSISIKGIRRLLHSGTALKKISICEIGCGGGDNLKAIEKWSNENNIEVKFTGIDIKAECIEYARRQYPLLNAQWIVSDYKTMTFIHDKPDIIFSSLFCHHFHNDEIIKMLQWMSENATIGFFINDLHRHPLAYYPIKLITGIFSRSYLVKNDAPLSVARGFKIEEWQQLTKQAGLINCSIRWEWAFRHLIIYRIAPGARQYYKNNPTG